MIQLAVGDDDVNFANAVTVGNTVTSKDLPAAALTDTAPIVTVTGQHALCAQNLTRRRITLFADPRNVGDLFIPVRKTGGANNIAIILPGTYVQFSGTYGLDYLGGATAGDSVYVFEES